MNYIFGSGVVGLAAKKVLSGDWTVVPFSRSRFYSFNPPLADNFIGRDKDIDEMVADLTGLGSIWLYKRAYSVGGNLVARHDPALCGAWLAKVFGGSVPAHAQLYMSTRMVQSVY